jgi:hypothetical protein
LFLIVILIIELEVFIHSFFGIADEMEITFFIILNMLKVLANGFIDALEVLSVIE